MTEQEYNEIDAIRATQLKALATGGDLALWAATYGEKSDTPAMRFGRLCHALALLPYEEVKAQFVVAPFADFRTKEAREWKAAQIEKGVDICTEAEMQTAREVGVEFGMVAEREGASGAKKGDDTEVSVVAEIAGGVRIKARADLLSADRSVLFDLKTTSSVTEAENQFWRLRYDIQAGLSRRGEANRPGVRRPRGRPPQAQRQRPRRVFERGRERRNAPAPLGG